MESVTIELTSETLDALDAYADCHHGDDREAAVRQLLDEWLVQHQ
jgi:metal-responsive CopG/Arc/MetJ family transcriptional regulator